MLLLHDFGLQQYSKIHYRSPFIHEIDALSALSYLLQCVCARTFIVFQRANTLIRLWFWETLGLHRHETTSGKGQDPFLHEAPTHSLFRFHIHILWVEQRLSLYLLVTLKSEGSVVMSQRDEMRSLFVLCSFCILSDFSVSVFLAPLWSGTHFCFVSLNIPVIVALTEVKPLLISFVYIVEDGDRGSMGETACWKGEEAIIMIVLFGSTRAPLVWEEEKDVLCFVYERVAKAAMGNLWACHQAFSDCSAVSQPFCNRAEHTAADTLNERPLQFKNTR